MHTITYRAVLRGNRLEWQGEPPPGAVGERSIPVDVTLLGERTLNASRDANSGERMAAALENLAAARAVVGIEDPVAWQRETRRDRPLPGRD